MYVILTTASSAEEADRLASGLVESALAPCVQIMPKMTSVYVWEGGVQKDQEHLLLIKTLPEKWNKVREFITASHSYEVPEIVAIEAVQVAEPYRKWLEASLTSR
jgi:periplasmic divalent cation tolerance protein